MEAICLHFHTFLLAQTFGTPYYKVTYAEGLIVRFQSFLPNTQRNV